MGDNDNNNLDLGDLTKSIINKGNQTTAKVSPVSPVSSFNINTAVSNSNKVLKSNKGFKKVVLQIRMNENEFLILKDHLEKIGYDTHSTGARGIIKKYMRENGLIE